MKKLIQTSAFLLLVLSLFTGLQVQAQGSQALYRAEKLYEIGNYEQALPAYLKLLDEGEDTPYLQYKIGASYIEQSEFGQKIKALEHLKKAKTEAGNLPAHFWLAYGDALQLNNLPQEALEAYATYAKQAKDSKAVAKAEERKAQAQLAIELMGNPKSISLSIPSASMNSEFTEYNPVVSADERVMAYTQLKNAGSRSATEQILIMTRDGNNWSEPQPFKVGNFNAGTAGISADGQTMLIYLQDNTGGNLYAVQRKGNNWGQPQKLEGDINSRYTETTASISADGRKIYFASDRPGGYGGLDLYVTELEGNGRWGRAINLGAEVNTPADEDAPYIHPNGKTLFYTSNGKLSIGGNDILRTDFVAGKWQLGKNLGYPLNTVANESYLTVTADGSRAYFSSDRPGGKGEQDVYMFTMPEEDRNIPLTMMKGRILAGEEEKPVPTQIYVVDVQTGNKLDYVYNPDPETGNYLIILPPGRNYDLVVKAEGYLPYAINVNIPNQDYFYELYQQIFLRPVKQFDEVVGQEVQVKNAFYDTGQPLHHDLKKIKESTLVQGDSVDVYEMMETIIGAGDTDAFEYVLELMYEVNPIENVDFENSAQGPVETAEVAYYYEENDKTKLEAKKVGGETIYTLPTFYVTKEAEKQKDQPKAKYDKALLAEVYKIYFEADSKTLNKKDEEMLDKVLAKIKTTDQLGIEISGYASNDGDAEYNRKLSNERAIAVLGYMNERGLLRRKIVAKGYGATESTSNAQEGRRVELRIVEIK